MVVQKGRRGDSRSSRQARRLKVRQHRIALRHTKDMKWVSPLAARVKDNAEVIALFMAEVLAGMAVNSRMESKLFSDTRLSLIQDITKLLFPAANEIFSNIERSFQSLEFALSEISADILRDSDITRELLAPTIESLGAAIEANPQLVVFLGSPDILKDAFGSLGERLATILSVIPALSQKASEALPDLEEVLFGALFRLNDDDRQQLYTLAEEILQHTYREHVFPRLEEILAGDPRGRVLAPILKGAIRAIPGAACLNTVLAIAATVRSQLTIGRIISIAIQNLGGLYVKLSQVIAELSPPSLARELRTTQDDAGGIFPSIDASWNYVLGLFEEDILQEWRAWLEMPEATYPHFASASMGAIYEIRLTAEGRQRFDIEHVLLKVQRPGLADVFREQCNHLLSLCDEAQAQLFVDEASPRSPRYLTEDQRSELLGIVAAIRRAILGYYRQSREELDFRLEEENAHRVARALQGNESIRIPRFYFSAPHLVIMERMPGTKITRIVQTKYLERRNIADHMIMAYLDLLFTHGVVWADPHPGNILYDDVSAKVAMIDLNPCFVWTPHVREEFKHLLYRLFLRDASGVHTTLLSLVDDKDALVPPRVLSDLQKFLNAPINSGSLIRFVGEFIKTLNENGIDLRPEVQAALRGLSQLALTASSVSARNDFGRLLRRHFRFREMLETVWQVGPVRVFRVVVSLVFEVIRLQPEVDVGPVLDEQDIAALRRRIHALRRAAVCDIEFRRVNPDDHPNLRMSADGSELLVTSDLTLEIIDKARPATVHYLVDIPSRSWLLERQEFVKLTSIARNLAIIECFEQLRRNSLDDFWHLVESWSKPLAHRTVRELRLVGSVKTAARRLYALRFVSIWDRERSGVPWLARRVWALLLRVECWREEAVQSYLRAMSPQFANVILGNLAFGTLYRIRMLVFEGFLWILRSYLKNLRFSMNLLPMGRREFEEVLLQGLSRHDSGRNGESVY